MRFYPPGTRRRNRSYIVRGVVKGQQFEIRTSATNEKAARKEWDRFVSTVESETNYAPNSFAAVAEAYKAAKSSSEAEIKFIDRIVGEIGHRMVAEITPSEAHEVAERLYKGRANATKNRQGLNPISAVLNYAAESNLRPAFRVKRFKETPAPTRRPKPGTIDTLIKATEGRKRLLLLIWKYQGWRISETLGLEAEHIDLHRGIASLYIGKARKWKEIHLHPAVVDEMKAQKINEHKGRVFVWSVRYSVYNWLRPLVKKHKVAFTPHMARHEFGSRADAAGITAHGMTEIGSWTDPKSTERYKTAHDDEARAALKKVWGK